MKFWTGKVDRIDASKHFGLVAMIAGRCCRLRPNEKLEETEEFSDGLVGLSKAIRLFKLALGCKFSTFAFYCIRNEIWSSAKRRRVAQGGSIPLSTFDTEDCGFEMGELDPALDNFDINAQMRDIITISPKDEHSLARKKRVLEMLFFEGYTLKEAGLELGVCRERIRQIKEEALEHFRYQFGLAMSNFKKRKKVRLVS
jgi:RNA polymerase sigma factor (sigma-70 family)